MKLAQLSTRTLVGGLFGLTLSFVFAETCSDGLFEIYSSSTLFRNVTGNAPNFLANGLNKISWAIFFGACWWMLWKFDLFFTLIPEIKDEGSEESSDFTQGAQSSKNEKEEETIDTDKVINIESLYKDIEVNSINNNNSNLTNNLASNQNINKVNSNNDVYKNETILENSKETDLT